MKKKLLSILSVLFISANLIAMEDYKKLSSEDQATVDTYSEKILRSHFVGNTTRLEKIAHKINSEGYETTKKFIFPQTSTIIKKKKKKANAENNQNKKIDKEYKKFIEDQQQHYLEVDKFKLEEVDADEIKNENFFNCTPILSNNKSYNYFDDLTDLDYNELEEILIGPLQNILDETQPSLNNEGQKNHHVQFNENVKINEFDLDSNEKSEKQAHWNEIKKNINKNKSTQENEIKKNLTKNRTTQAAENFITKLMPDSEILDFTNTETQFKASQDSDKDGIDKELFTKQCALFQQQNNGQKQKINEYLEKLKANEKVGKSGILQKLAHNLYEFYKLGLDIPKLSCIDQESSINHNWIPQELVEQAIAKNEALKREINGCLNREFHYIGKITYSKNALGWLEKDWMRWHDLADKQTQDKFRYPNIKVFREQNAIDRFIALNEIQKMFVTLHINGILKGLLIEPRSKNEHFQNLAFELLTNKLNDREQLTNYVCFKTIDQKTDEAVLKNRLEQNVKALMRSDKQLPEAALIAYKRYTQEKAWLNYLQSKN